MNRRITIILSAMQNEAISRHTQLSGSMIVDVSSSLVSATVFDQQRLKLTIEVEAVARVRRES